MPIHFRPAPSRLYGSLCVFAVAAVLLLASISAQQQPAPQSGIGSILLSELRDKIVYLASKDMKGRGNGSPELERAAGYIADAFERNQLQPAGDDRTYFQKFQLFVSRLGPRNSASADRTVFRLGTDFVPHYLSANGVVEGPAVFVGYGISAPHLEFDEFAGRDVQGKVVIVIDGSPRLGDQSSPFSRFHPSDFASVVTKAANAQRAGAAALIVLQDPRIQNYSMEQLKDTFEPAYPLRYAPMGAAADPANPKLPVVMMSWAAGRNLVPGIADFQRRIDRTLTPETLPATGPISLEVQIVRVPLETRNVLGWIEGSDPDLRNEVVVIGAHYDHDGEYQGQIWAGADDNASGTAGLIELAEAFGNGRAAPRRSILLAAFSGEEKGEIGSHHYVNNPARPLEQTIAMLQLDMIGRNEEHPANRQLGLERETSAANANAVNIIGSLFSPDLGLHFSEANAATGLQLKFRYDDTAENLLRRSDQWPFLQKGIPALFVHTGEHPDYHQPGDTPDKINYPKLERIVRLVFIATERIADSPDRPRYVQP